MKILDHGVTLGFLADKYSAVINDADKDKIALRVVEAKNMYFSGTVLLHISVMDKTGGLNNTFEWPWYLVDDEGTKKIISA